MPPRKSTSKKSVAVDNGDEIEGDTVYRWERPGTEIKRVGPNGEAKRTIRPPSRFTILRKDDVQEDEDENVNDTKPAKSTKKKNIQDLDNLIDSDADSDTEERILKAVGLLDESDDDFLADDDEEDEEEEEAVETKDDEDEESLSSDEEETEEDDEEYSGETDESVEQVDDDDDDDDIEDEDDDEIDEMDEDDEDDEVEEKPKPKTKDGQRKRKRDNDEQPEPEPEAKVAKVDEAVETNADNVDATKTVVADDKNTTNA